MCGTGTKKIILYRGRDRDQKKNFTRTRTGTERKITGTTTGTGTNAWIRGYMMVLTLSIFVRQKSLYSKKEPKSASRRLNKLKKTSIEEFFRWNFEL